MLLDILSRYINIINNTTIETLSTKVITSNLAINCKKSGMPTLCPVGKKDEQ